MVRTKTLSIYLLKLYISYFISILLIITGALILANIFDLIQKFKAIHVPAYYFWRLILYKIPYLLNELSSLISFSSMLFLLTRLTKYNELITMLCGGIHTHKIIIVPVLAAIILGIVIITIFNPISVIGLHKHQLLETKLTKKTANNFISSQSGLLFIEKRNNKKIVIQAKSIDVTNSKLNKVTLLFLDNNNNFLERIDANYAIIKDHKLELASIDYYNGNKNFKKYENLSINTNLTIKKLLNSFIIPEMISIWDFPIIIKQLTEVGLSTINYQIYYYKQLFKPMIMCTMVVFASCFFSLNQRDNSQGKILIIGLFVGFVVYFLLEVLFRILSYNITPLFLAIFLPNIAVLLLSNFVIMHFKSYERN